MLTQDQVLDAVRNGRQSECLDGRDYARLVSFFPVEIWAVFGFKPTDEAGPHEPEPWTQEAILVHLERDLAFAFDKALNKRGISASFMYATIKTWLWILEDDELVDFEEYAQYGLPLLKAVAVKYGFDNPIGQDYGNEFKYSADADW